MSSELRLSQQQQPPHLDFSIDIQHVQSSLIPSHFGINNINDLHHNYKYNDGENSEDEGRREQQQESIKEKLQETFTNEQPEEQIHKKESSEPYDELNKWKVKLHKAITGDHLESSSVKKILDSRSGKGTINGLNTTIWENTAPILHQAIIHKLEIGFITTLIGMISNEELALTNSHRENALHTAVACNNAPIIKLLVARNPEMVNARDTDGDLPVHLAARILQREMTYYLLRLTKQEEQFSFGDKKRSDLVLIAISAGWYDLALYLLKCNPMLEWHISDHPMDLLINESGAFLSTSPFNMIQSLVYSYLPVHLLEFTERWELEGPEHSGSPKIDCRGSTSIFLRVLLLAWKQSKKIWAKLGQPIDEIRQAKIRHQLALEIIRDLFKRLRESNSQIEVLPFRAVENGISEMVEIILEAFPNAIDYRNENGHTVLDIAVMYRHQKILEIVLKHVPQRFSAMTTDHSGEVLLFRVAHKPLQNRLDNGPGLVFQMQRELRWYQELEKLFPEQRRMRNLKGQLPLEIFKEEHESLVEYENKWMMEMANTCIVGGSLIATVVFAAAITVPGGNNSGTGFPFFINKMTYQVFFVSNIMSLIFSISSVLIFLSIFTARHSLSDYLYSLPSRLILGLIFLFLSFTSLIIDFTAITYLTSGPEHRHNIYIAAALGCIPVGLFSYLQLPSLINMIESTFGHQSFLKSLDDEAKRTLSIS